VAGSNDGQILDGMRAPLGSPASGPGKGGRQRYTAYYCDLHDRERSAGTFPNKKDADKAWQ
jgi:hypothetical protein